MKHWTFAKNLLSHPFSLIFFSFFPILVLLFYFYFNFSHLTDLQERVLSLQKKKTWTQSKRKSEERLMNQLKEADRDYLLKALSSLEFLHPEIKKLQVLLHADPGQEAFKRRLSFLQSKENRLEFKEHHFEQYAHILQVQESLEHSIEVNKEDLQELLLRIEGSSFEKPSASFNPPHLIIKHFQLKKKAISASEETYLVDFELIKHEIIHE